MLNKMIFTGLMLLILVPAAALAVESQNDLSQAAPSTAVDNFTAPSAADAAAVSAIEPAAGGGNIFTATLDMDAQKAAAKRAQDPDRQGTAAEKTRRASGAGVQ